MKNPPGVTGGLSHGKPSVNSWSLSFAMSGRWPDGHRGATIMPVEMLSYVELGERLKISPEAARALVKRHRLPRSRSNTGKTLVHADLTELSHSPVTPAPPHAGPGHQVLTALKDHIATLQADLLDMKTIP